jgi:phage tail-like protein
MAVLRDRPVLNSNFLVDFGDGTSREAGGGFAEISFPEFRIGTSGDNQALLPVTASPRPGEPANTLTLKRGVCGALNLYAWWDKARNGKAPPRKTLKVHLLGEDQQTVVLTWTFHNVRPQALSYSPLRAQETAVVIETLELAFDRFELS